MRADAPPAAWQAPPLPAARVPAGVSAATGHDWETTFREDLAADERAERRLSVRQVLLIGGIALLLVVREMLL